MIMYRRGVGSGCLVPIAVPTTDTKIIYGGHCRGVNRRRGRFGMSAVKSRRRRGWRAGSSCTGPAVQATLLGVQGEDPLLRAQPVHPVLPGGHAVVTQLVGDQAVTELRGTIVDLQCGVDQCASSQSRSVTGPAFHR